MQLLTRITPNGFTSREGYAVTIHDYGDKIVMTIADGVQETWNIKINAVAHKEQPLTDQEKKLRELASKYCVSGSEEVCETLLPLPEVESATVHNRKAVFAALLNSFAFAGVNETLGVKVGSRTSLPYNVNRTFVGVHVTFIRFAVINRSGQAMNIQRVMKEQSENGMFELLNRSSQQQTPHHASRPVKTPSIQYGLGTERSKLRQLSNSIIKDGGVNVPAGRVERLITTLEIKYKLTPRKQAYEHSVNDVIEWFKKNTKPKS